MTSQGLLLIGIVAGLLLLLFAVGKRGYMKPTKLNSRAGNKRPDQQAVLTRSKESLNPLEGASRNLNVMFMFNGHTFDAYEVLGLPAGSDLDRVRGAYESAKRQADPQSQQFLEYAYRVIVKDRKG